MVEQENIKKIMNETKSIFETLKGWINSRELSTEVKTQNTKYKIQITNDKLQIKTDEQNYKFKINQDVCSFVISLFVFGIYLLFGNCCL